MTLFKKKSINAAAALALKKILIDQMCFV